MELFDNKLKVLNCWVTQRLRLDIFNPFLLKSLHLQIHKDMNPLKNDFHNKSHIHKWKLFDIISICRSFTP